MKKIITIIVLVLSSCVTNAGRGKIKLGLSPSGNTTWCAFTREPELAAHDARCMYKTQIECARDVIDMRRTMPELFTNTICELRENLEKWYDVY